MAQYNTTSLIASLSTNWKDQHEFMNIIYKHAPSIDAFLAEEMEKFSDSLHIYPPPDIVFNAFNQFNIEDLKIVIIGQDPYIHKGEAMGLSFSVPTSIKCPPSLRNIFKELQNEYGEPLRTNTDLTDWAKQGILLLNRALTVREGQSLSHMKCWKDFTEDVLRFINAHTKNVVYILWGKCAQDIIPFINTKENCVLCHTHPSPLSRKPFVGNGHFRKCNEYLAAHHKDIIGWL